MADLTMVVGDTEGDYQCTVKRNGVIYNLATSTVVARITRLRDRSYVHVPAILVDGANGVCSVPRALITLEDGEVVLELQIFNNIGELQFTAPTPNPIRFNIRPLGTD